MTARDSGTTRTAPRPALRWCATNRHFLIACVILAVAAAGWQMAVQALEIVIIKKPVPWPAGVVVSEDFRLQSLPDRFGPYVLVGDGERERDRSGEPVRDGRPDGETIFRGDMMEVLKIGTSSDRSALGRRMSNWYVARAYRDTRLPEGHPLRYWQLEAYYYTTGGVDVVPHIPEICGRAAGATILGTQDVPMAIPAAGAPWDHPVDFRRTLAQNTTPDNAHTYKTAQYYTFSLNGRPENSRELVRLKLLDLFVRHAYFAKIQFGPQGPVYDEAQADRAAKDFAEHSLPDVLKALPTADDVKKLDARR